jgi:amino acid permease
MKKTQQNGLSIIGTALALISSIIGGGIISLPYSFVAAGFYPGLCIHLFAVMMFSISVTLLLKSKDNLGYE